MSATSRKGLHGIRAASICVGLLGLPVIALSQDLQLDESSDDSSLDEITIVGSRCGPFEPAIRALENNLVKVDALIDQTYPFSRALQAFEHAKQRGSLKIILDFDE